MCDGDVVGAGGVASLFDVIVGRGDRLLQLFVVSGLGLHASEASLVLKKATQ
jgi:hypothetical protein